MADPAISLVSWARLLWRQLTSMRTALLLLLILGLAAIPGSLLPQRPVDPLGVVAWIREHPGWGPAFRAAGLFDVYASGWFAAIYLLLFVSLIGCIIPRWRDLWRARRAEPAMARGRLSRMAAHAAGRVMGVDVPQAAASWLRSRGFRVTVGEGELAAERGLWRELGNLIFHTALIGVLAGVAGSALWGYRGAVIVVEGSGFSHALSQYDDFSSGGAFTPDQLRPFTAVVEDFAVEFDTSPRHAGLPQDFRAHIRLTEDGRVRTEEVSVNHPLEVAGAQLHLMGHGYAPAVTVRDGNGDVAWSGPVVFLPQDAMFSSSGVIKAPDARPDELAFEGLFLPTAVVDERGPVSVFPDLWNPELFLTGWYGPPRTSDGTPQNVYELDTEGLTQLTQGEAPLAVRLAVGDSIDLPDGRGRLTFDRPQRWVKLQVSSQPGTAWALGFIMVAVAGMTASLLLKPRRLYVRWDADEVEVAGFDPVAGRSGLAEDVAELRNVCTGGGQ